MFKYLSKSILLVLLVGVPGFSLPPGRQAISLAEALERASVANLRLAMARAAQDEAAGQNLGAWSGLLPHLSAGEQYLKTNDPVSVFGLKLQRGIFTQSDFDLRSLNFPEAFENYTTSLQLQVPLFNARAILGKAAAVELARAARAGYQHMQQRVALQVKKAYYGLVLARQARAAMEKAVVSARMHRDNARSALDQGLIHEADFLASEVRLAELREQLLIARNSVQDASNVLRLVLGIDSLIELEPTDSLPLPEAVTLPEPSVPLERRPDLEALAFRAKAARWQHRASLTAWVPELSAFASREWYGDRFLSTASAHYTIGVQLTWHLFDGFAQLGQRKVAGAHARQVQATYRMARLQAYNQLDAARRAIQLAWQRIQVSRRALQQAESSLHITEKRFQQGMARMADLLDAETRLTNSRLRWLRARHDYVLALNEWYYQTGNQNLFKQP